MRHSKRRNFGIWILTKFAKLNFFKICTPCSLHQVLCSGTKLTSPVAWFPLMAFQEFSACHLKAFCNLSHFLWHHFALHFAILRKDGHKLSILTGDWIEYRKLIIWLCRHWQIAMENCQCLTFNTPLVREKGNCAKTNAGKSRTWLRPVVLSWTRGLQLSSLITRQVNHKHANLPRDCQMFCEFAWELLFMMNESTLMANYTSLSIFAALMIGKRQRSCWDSFPCLFFQNGGRLGRLKGSLSFTYLISRNGRNIGSRALSVICLLCCDLPQILIQIQRICTVTVRDFTQVHGRRDHEGLRTPHSCTYGASKTKSGSDLFSTHSGSANTLQKQRTNWYMNKIWSPPLMSEEVTNGALIETISWSFFMLGNQECPTSYDLSCQSWLAPRHLEGDHHSTNNRA